MALSRKARESVNTIEHLLGGLDGLRWEWTHRKRHLMLRIFVAGDPKPATITVSVSASDARARMNQLGDVKRALRQKGVAV